MGGAVGEHQGSTEAVKRWGIDIPACMLSPDKGAGWFESQLFAGEPGDSLVKASHPSCQDVLLPNYAFIREVGAARWAWRTAIRQMHKRILRDEHGMRLPTGEWMALPFESRFASEAFVTGADVDWGSERLLASLLSGTGVMLDVGANIGYYSLYMLPRVRAVYSFEPDPRALKGLKKNVGSNGKVEIVACAVGAVPGRATFVLDENAERSHLASEDAGGAGTIEVEVTTIDAFVKERGVRVEAIKIDAEGHDTEVLEGALGTLTGQRPLVLTEAEPGETLFRIAAEVGYRVFAFVRERESRRRRFTELEAEVPVAGETKMLFLVAGETAKRVLEAVERS